MPYMLYHTRCIIHTVSYHNPLHTPTPSCTHPHPPPHTQGVCTDVHYVDWDLKQLEGGTLSPHAHRALLQAPPTSNMSDATDDVSLEGVCLCMYGGMPFSHAKHTPPLSFHTHAFPSHHPPPLLSHPYLSVTSPPSPLLSKQHFSTRPT